MPNISVVIPSYNRRIPVLRAIDSVINQSYRDFDLWIVDDGSNDGTDEAITELIKSNPTLPIHYIYKAKKGVAAARNRGVQESGGTWIAFLDSDDEWKPNKLEIQIRFAETNLKYQLIHSEETWIRNGKRVNPPKIYHKSGGDIFLQSLPVCLISPSTVLMSRKLFNETRGFNEEYPVCEDYDLWLRITASHFVGFVPEALTIKYGGHSDQLSRGLVGIDYWRIKALCNLVKNVSLSESRRQAVLEEVSRKARILLDGYLKHGRPAEYHDAVKMIREIDPDFRGSSNNSRTNPQ